MVENTKSSPSQGFPKRSVWIHFFIQKLVLRSWCQCRSGAAPDVVRLRKRKQNGHRVFLFFYANWSGKSGENMDNQDTSVIKRMMGKKAGERLAFERPLWAQRNCLRCLCKRDDLHVHRLTAHERKRWMGWKKMQEREKFMENEVRFPKPWKSKFGPWISTALRNFEQIHSAPSKYHFSTNYSTRV